MTRVHVDTAFMFSAELEYLSPGCVSNSSSLSNFGKGTCFTVISYFRDGNTVDTGKKIDVCPACFEAIQK